MDLPAGRQKGDNLHPVFRHVLPLLVFCAVSLFSFQASSAPCEWTVSGKVSFLDDLYSYPKKNRALVGGRIKVWASVLESGGWALWGDTRTNSEGRYHLTKKPAMSGALWCDAKRRFKVKVVFESDKAKILTLGQAAQSHVISNRSKWREGRNVDISYRFHELNDPDRAQLSGRYVATRAAQFFYGFQKYHSWLKRQDLDPRKFQVVWPSGKGSTLEQHMWSPPLGAVLIPKSEFWFYDENGKKWTYRSTEGRDAKDCLHEGLHQWFHDHVYVPNYLVGATLGTHDFLETAALSFYEAVAEMIALSIDQDIFPDAFDSGLPKPQDFNTMLRVFREAKKKSGENYYTQFELDALVRRNGNAWQKDLYRSEYAVKNYLALLMDENWFEHAPDYGSLTPENTPDVTFDCRQVPSPLFSPVELLRALKAWRGEFNGRIPEGERGITGFYDLLASQDPDFSEYRDLLIKMGNPHYGDHVSGWQACQQY